MITLFKKEPEKVYKRGTLVQTGYGAVIFLTDDLRHGQCEGINGVVLHSERNPERVGRYREGMFTSSGIVKPYEGHIVIKN